jgi:glycosyltransferase involved in cell wall biosynthesis
MPKISIVIPTHNCGNYIAEALDSILIQDIEDAEIVIVDDGSKDQTALVVSGYIQRYPKKIRYFYQENQGVSSARNRGLSESTGEYITFVDADDKVLNDSLSKQKEFLDRNPNIDLVFSDWYINQEEKSVLKSGRFTDSFKDVLYCNGPDFVSKNNFLVRFLTFSPHPILLTTVMLRRRIIDAIGSFRVDLLNAEDLEFIIRILKVRQVGYIDQPLYLYRCQLSQNSKKIERYYLHEIKVYEEFKVQNISKEINQILKRKVSNAYFELGYFYKENLSLHASRKSLLSSIMYNPFQKHSYKTLMGTFIPTELLNFLKHAQS